jgi:hypothetical protein
MARIPNRKECLWGRPLTTLFTTFQIRAVNLFRTRMGRTLEVAGPGVGDVVDVVDEKYSPPTVAGQVR